MAHDALEPAVPHSQEAREATASIVRVSAGVVRMRRLIDDLLAYATARDAALTTAAGRPATPLVDDVVTERRRPPAPSARTSTSARCPSVHADPALLRHCWTTSSATRSSTRRRAARPKVDVSAPPAGSRTGSGSRSPTAASASPTPTSPTVFDVVPPGATHGQSYGGTGPGPGHLPAGRRPARRHDQRRRQPRRRQPLRFTAADRAGATRFHARSRMSRSAVRRAVARGGRVMTKLAPGSAGA